MPKDRLPPELRKTKPKKKSARKKGTEARTLVALVLDTSGSMSSMKEQAIGLFNQQRDEIAKGAKKAGETRLSLVLFGTGYIGGGVQVVHEHATPDTIARLTDATYRPQAGTPMRDGIGTAINILERHDDGGENTAMLVVVVTDGMENASREWTAEALSKKVVELQGTGRWTFALYGCGDLDLAELKEMAGLGAIPPGNLGIYGRGADGMAAGAVVMASATSSYMGSRSLGVTASKSFATPEGEEEK